MSQAQWADVSRLFEQLIDGPAETIDERIRYSQLAPDAQQLLRKMIAAHTERSILDETVDRLAERLLDADFSAQHSIPEDLVGRSFGCWRVTRELARGGMGAVFEAERADGQFEKTVALKVIKPGAYSAHTAERFAEEMRTLARLEHPCIARLVDGGLSDEDIPYFAMERVDGVPITRYADDHRLDLSARIELLIQVCAAVEHAHRNLIVHGDLKPSNILVNRAAEVRLLDFGIAQSLRPKEGKPSLPRFTLRYAAPEQADGQRLTTSCDVFGLGAVLFELCCGVAPRCAQASDEDQAYREQLRAPLESARQQFERAPEQANIAGRRGLAPRALRRLLGGDLGWILHKGLAIEPGQRYSNVAELRAELDRWRHGMAIEAHPPQTGYRLRRWLGRHRLPTSIAAAAVLGLAIAGAGAMQQSRIATLEAAKAHWSKEFLLSIFKQADPVLNQQQPITVNELTDGAADKLLGNRGSFASELQLEAASVLAEVQTNLGQYESALALSQLRVDLARRGTHQRELLAALLANGESLLALDQLQPAMERFREVLALSALDRQLDPISVAATLQLAMLLARVSEYEEARGLVEALLRYEQRIAASADGARSLSLAYSTRGVIERDLGQTAAARASIERALSYGRTVGEHSRTYVDALAGLAALHYSTGDAASTAEVDQQVVELFDEIYGRDHPLTLKARSELAVSLSQLGEMPRALELNAEVLAGYRGRLGEDNQYVAGTLANMGAAQRALGRFEESLDLYQQSLAIWNRLESTPPTSLASVLLAHGRVLIELRRYPEARHSFLQALDLIEQTLGRDHVLYSRAQAYYAPVLIEIGEIEAAAALLEGAYAHLLKEYGEDSTRVSIASVTLAQLRAAQGNNPEAARLSKQAMAVLDSDGVRQRHAIELAKARKIRDRAESR